ncbi:MAG TPA: PA domain-containing protein [Acidimicrobiales bacterium]|nr:PA domain-containing protein [Acidimicrobiales bacterium]
MSRLISARGAAAGLAAAAVLALPATTIGHGVDHNSPATDRSPYTVTGKGKYRTTASDDASSFSAQHGGSDLHLPASRENVRMLSKFKPLTPFGNVLQGQIADVSIFKTTAYLNSWEDPECKRGGVYAVNISNPNKPSQRGFIPALPGNYHGEGAHVITADTTNFKGDLLAVNNEFCVDDPAAGGGFDLYDVTDPSNPEILVQGAGDRGKDGVLGGSGPLANSYHSVFLWQAGAKVYAVGVDNVELHDVDIFDVTDPRRPKPVGEYDLLEMFPSIEDQSANNDEIFLHDMVVKEIGGRQIMSASYWDAGYVILDVTNPAKPTLIRDSSFDGPDPLVPGIDPPEGNAHQSEFSRDNEYLLAADEDFAPYRPKTFSIEGVEYPASEVGGGTSQASLPDLTLNGPTVYGGYGCPGTSRIPPREDVFRTGSLPAGEDAIVVLQRGPSGDSTDTYEACFPGEKAAEAKAAGYDAVILINRHLGSAGADEPYCGSGGYPAGVSMVTLCISHTAGHALFGDATPEYATPYDDEAEMAAIGTVGKKVVGTSEFDGWGYGHLYRNSGTKMERIDSYAVPESLDPAYAFNYGDLSIHEFAADPDRNLAYTAYYSAGLRVLKFNGDGLTEVGHFIDQGGNNFWGIEQYTTSQNRRLIAASDRDHGLYLFEYTGR